MDRLADDEAAVRLLRAVERLDERPQSGGVEEGHTGEVGDDQSVTRPVQLLDEDLAKIVGGGEIEFAAERDHVRIVVPVVVARFPERTVGHGVPDVVVSRSAEGHRDAWSAPTVVRFRTGRIPFTRRRHGGPPATAPRPRAGAPAPAGTTR